jgi:N-acetylmuramoyl-L-alanine amidase
MDTLLNPSDICLDIHFNSFTSEKASGSEIIIPEYPDSTEKQLAEDLLKCTCDILKTKSRKVKKESQSQHGRLAMLRDIHCKNILVEICFVSNK